MSEEIIKGQIQISKRPLSHPHEYGGLNVFNNGSFLVWCLLSKTVYCLKLLYKDKNDLSSDCVPFG